MSMQRADESPAKAEGIAEGIAIGFIIEMV
jgi:hypothetical protein